MYRRPSQRRTRSADSSRARSPSPSSPTHARYPSGGGQGNAPPRTPGHRSSREKRGRDRGYSLPSGKRQVTLLLCVFHSTKHVWKTHPVVFDPRKTDDRELWEDIRSIFRNEIQKSWRRVFGFKKVMSIVPIAVCIQLLCPYIRSSDRL